MSRTKIPINTYYDSNFKFLNNSEGSQDINVEDIDGGAKKTERRSIKLKSNANINCNPNWNKSSIWDVISVTQSIKHAQMPSSIRGNTDLK